MKKVIWIPVKTTAGEKADIYIAVDIVGNLEGCKIREIGNPVIMPDNFTLNQEKA